MPLYTSPISLIKIVLHMNVKVSLTAYKHRTDSTLSKEFLVLTILPPLIITNVVAPYFSYDSSYRTNTNIYLKQKSPKV